MASNLPSADNIDSAKNVKEFYDKYFTKKLSFPSNDVDAVIGFFQSRGFSKSSAISVGTVILQQAKLDGIKVFELLDTLKNADSVQLSSVVTEVLNYNREKISTLGYRVNNTINRIEARNIEV
jgi:hypothetical protein